jgi:hypothetical protein
MKLKKYIFFVITGKNILLYTQYKKKQALWLQSEDSKRTNRATNTEQFCIQCYRNYLRLIGFKKESTFDKIQTYIRSIGNYHLVTGNDMYNNGYNEKIAENINKLMDEILF